MLRNVKQAQQVGFTLAEIEELLRLSIDGFDASDRSWTATTRSHVSPTSPGTDCLRPRQSILQYNCGAHRQKARDAAPLGARLEEAMTHASTASASPPTRSGSAARGAVRHREDTHGVYEWLDVAPAAPLRLWVACYTGHREHVQTPVRRLETPSGGAVLVLRFGAPLTVSGAHMASPMPTQNVCSSASTGDNITAITTTKTMTRQPPSQSATRV